MSWNSLLSAENIGKGILLVTILVVWLFILHVLKKTKLDFWHFVVGGAGTFVMSFVLLRPVLTEPLARVVALFNSLVGQITGMYSTYYKYGTIFIDSVSGALSLKIDFEGVYRSGACAGGNRGNSGDYCVQCHSTYRDLYHDLFWWSRAVLSGSHHSGSTGVLRIIRSFIFLRVYETSDY